MKESDRREIERIREIMIQWERAVLIKDINVAGNAIYLNSHAMGKLVLRLADLLEAQSNDAERLDWAQNHLQRIRQTVEQDYWIDYVDAKGNSRDGGGDSLRKAIDAAMKEQP